MQEDKLRYLLGRRLHGGITPAEEEELHALLEDERNKDLFLATLTGLMPDMAENAAYDAARWEPVKDRILAADKDTPVLPIRRNWWKWTAAAAVAGILAVAAWEYGTREALPPASVSMDGRYKNDVPPGGNHASLTLANGSVIVLDDAENGLLAKQGNAQVTKLHNGQLAYTKTGNAAAVAWNRLATPRGGQYRITLPDGTAVWLNAETVLHFPTAFEGNERKVELSGEAYFEVAKDAVKPFVVKATDGLDVKVLGTHFNISAYAGEPSTCVTLLEGAVEVNRQRMEPGQEAVRANGQTVVRQGDTEQAVAWKNGYFSFNNADITTVMKELERWYNVSVNYETNVPHLRFGGGMQRSLPLASVLRILEKNDVKFKIDGRKITVLQ
ncbi:FecR family protein [Chitinophaga lutea]|uniref:FecR family protein n=1 Tax=Chitinophaga lutea TaxID=2488634 RepID=A0A3N4PNL1_9BACT|nr:FecR family protein [Chitinophaga lutea]RPE08229.1 FecR family protein [Chitinophaga lutea]